MRIMAGVAMGITVGGLFMLIVHLNEGIDPLDFRGVAYAVGSIGAVVGFFVGLAWECAYGPKQPPVNPPAPTPDSPSESN